MKDSVMGYFLFYIKYHVYTFITNIFKRKKREYLVFFVGKYPNNFKYGFKAILDYDSLFRFSIGSSCIITRFTTTKNIDEIKQIFNKIYGGYMDSYFLFDLKNSKHVINLEKNHKTHLYEPIKNINLEVSLDNAQHFIELINKQREIVISMMENGVFGDINNEESLRVTMDQIDPILDKIKEKGIESLTEEEKIILKKFNNT